MSIVWFIIIGLVAGLIARAVVPGRQNMGLVATALLGMVGSLAGGLIASLFTGERLDRLHPAGLIFSVVGAVVVLLLLGLARGGRRAHV
jgi:uncharacterized membrane protein YeaQ/YmgE (transglycosylase-associated protein family)